MDIRNWPLGRIMQLPDSCFGRRWLVGIKQHETAVAFVWDICEAALPEMVVLWHLNLHMTGEIAALCTVSLALGDVLPTSQAQFAQFEQLFRNVGEIAGGISRISLGTISGQVNWPMRQCVRAAGRRVVGEFSITAAAESTMEAVLTISSVPTEIPDCLLSV